MNNFAVQEMQANKMFRDWHNKLSSETYRVVGLGDGYYAIACPNFDAGLDEMVFEVTFVDCNFKAVGPIDVSTFPKLDALINFIQYKKKYMGEILIFCKEQKGLEVGTFDMPRDEEAEKAMREYFTQHQVSAADENSFKLQE